ncbi:MAG TPA: dihydrolipoyllysine-residue succinyltransferase [Vicinamibacterales bacterium]
MPNIVVPTLGESVVEARVARWLKQEGEHVAAGEPLVELETEKIDLEVSAEVGGVLTSITRREGEDVQIGEVLGVMEEGAAAAAPSAAPAPPPPAAPAPPPPVARPVEPLPPVPAALPRPAAPVTLAATRRAADPRGERRVRMTKRRATIARRLVEAQRTAAMLTTFNEVDMSAVMSLRERHKEAFKAHYGVGLGIASFFVKAAVGALRAFPQINAEIQGDEIVYKPFYDIGIAVGAEGGLVVPVLRDVDKMSFSGIELGIREFAKRAGDGTLTLEDLTGGTFTITNGGVFGSLLSTPILNPPQVGILGLHKIQDRPIAVQGQVVVRPMMYTALSYDHRIVDGREAVQFLVKVKEFIEDPGQLLLES